MFCGDFVHIGEAAAAAAGEGRGGEELHFNEAMEAWLTSR